MAVTNRDRVAKAFETLAEGLEPYVDRSMRHHLGEDWFDRTAAQERFKVSLHDPQFLLKVMRDSWQTVFSRTLGRTERTYVHELSDRRNDWAHNEPFSVDDADRTMDTAERLLNAVNAGQLAGSIRKQKEELRRLYFENDNVKAAKKLATSAEAPVAGLRPWREIALPHTDVQSGRYAQAEFAADLGQVARGEGSAEYVNPVEFFRRTFLTEGLSALLSEAVERVTGAAGGTPVIDLQTNFGGGKTHSLLALYHLLSGTPATSFPIEVQNLIGGRVLPDVQRAVLVGTQISPGQPSVKADGTKVRTLWGELAWQLGGRQAYELIAEADATSSSPGEGLRFLLEYHSPCLILIDEWVAYARQLYLDSTMPAGSFDTHFTFAQALTEAARTTPGVLLVVSIPASDRMGEGTTSGGSEIEVGGEGGREALRRLQSVVRRMDSSWRPASPRESYEIVRRRLFQEIDDAAGLQARDVTARRFGEHYRQYGGQLPRECLDPAYEQRIKQSYPIHPELFARLYEDWSTLEKFQQTRGVLRLMSKVIHALWARNDQAPLILPGNVPLGDEQVVGELTRNLEDRWKPILDTDVDGAGSLPARLDEEKTAFGQRAAARRVARAVFLGSAPTARNANKGIEDQRIRLGVLMPGEAPALFGDALRNLAERATYLYVENQRYWFSVQPTLSRKAAEIADRYAQRPEEVHFKLVERLRLATADRADFAAVHMSSTLASSDVSDEQRVRLVVIPPSQPHRPKAPGSEANIWARETLASRGTSPRVHRNMLVFLAADGQALTTLEQAVCAWLAWQEICQSLGEEELTPSQAQQARDRLTKAEEAVALRIAETYKWLLVPEQDQPPAGPTDLVEVRVEGPEALPVRVAGRLISDGRLHRELAPVHIRMKLDGPLASMWQDGDVRVQDLWEAFSRYPYLPRIPDVDVLLDAVRRGPAGLTWTIDGFAVATALDDTTGRYRGLVVNDESPTADLGSLVVQPELALTQYEQERTPPSETGSSSEDDIVDTQTDPTPGPAERTTPTRFSGSVHLDPERIVRTFGAVNSEVLAHLLNSGATVEVTLEVVAELPEGFEDATLRVISENAKTLKFDGPSFG